MKEKTWNDPNADQSRNWMQQCISAENLSAELDGEYHFTPDERTHIEHCARCRGLYESYRIVDDAVTRSLSVNCPRAAAFRIHRNVNRKLDSLAPMRSHEPVRFSALVARIAAGMVIAAMAGYLIFIDNPYSNELEETPHSRRQISARDHSNTRTAEPSPFFPDGVDIRNLRLAATGDGHSIRFMDPAEPAVKAEHVATIPAAVKHVWLFDPAWKAEQTENAVRSALKNAGIPLQDIKLEITGSGSIRVHSLLNRYQTVLLTRQLATRHFQLTSPAQPQPEQKLFAGTGKETVQYEAVFLPRGK